MATKKRLIDANALMASLRESLDELRKIGDGLSYHEEKQICNGQICTFLEAIMRVREQPTVDAVEVVRCKDCKHWVCWRGSGEGTGDCRLDEGYSTLATQHYDFCSYGERRTDNA